MGNKDVKDQISNMRQNIKGKGGNILEVTDTMSVTIFICTGANRISITPNKIEIEPEIK